mmetsp:Transcript_62775/g.99532  ORF Transcript_62775/g.99532 Transcript_62775/m.99532 type:complete len:180 (+) Transcript_62775:49-588(+)
MFCVRYGLFLGVLVLHISRQHAQIMRIESNGLTELAQVKPAKEHKESNVEVRKHEHSESRSLLKDSAEFHPEVKYEIPFPPQEGYYEDCKINLLDYPEPGTPNTIGSTQENGRNCSANKFMNPPQNEYFIECNCALTSKATGSTTTTSVVRHMACCRYFIDETQHPPYHSGRCLKTCGP